MDQDLQGYLKAGADTWLYPQIGSTLVEAMIISGG